MESPYGQVGNQQQRNDDRRNERLHSWNNNQRAFRNGLVNERRIYLRQQNGLRENRSFELDDEKNESASELANVKESKEQKESRIANRRKTNSNE